MTKQATKTVRFNKYHVTDGEIKARCHYSLDNRVDGRKCVTIYSKDYGYDLGKVIPEGYKNDTDSMTDYFDKGRVVLFEDHPLYAEARARVEGFKTVTPDQLAKQILNAFGRSLDRVGDVADAFEQGVTSACVRMAVDPGSDLAEQAARRAWKRVG